MGFAFSRHSFYNSQMHEGSHPPTRENESTLVFMPCRQMATAGGSSGVIQQYCWITVCQVRYFSTRKHTKIPDAELDGVKCISWSSSRIISIPVYLPRYLYDTNCTILPTALSLIGHFTLRHENSVGFLFCFSSLGISQAFAYHIQMPVRSKAHI